MRKLKSNRGPVTVDDIRKCLQDIQAVTPFNPPLLANGSRNNLLNCLYKVQHQLYPEDAKYYKDHTNWVLQMLSIRGWENKGYKKPDNTVYWHKNVQQRQEKEYPVNTIHIIESVDNPFDPPVSRLAFHVNNIMRNRYAPDNKNGRTRVTSLIYQIIRLYKRWKELYKDGVF